MAMASGMAASEPRGARSEITIAPSQITRLTEVDEFGTTMPIPRRGATQISRKSGESVTGVEEPPVRPLDCKRGEHAGAIGARVDSDAIRALIHLLRDGVAVDDDEPIIGSLVGEEWVTNPPQIRLALLVNRNSGANARVDEQIVTKSAAIHEAFKEFDVLLWNRF